PLHWFVHIRGIQPSCSQHSSNSRKSRSYLRSKWLPPRLILLQSAA
ncbi:bacterial NAD-glutamate dehydrogenase family protein, partial [Vibrio parahaemolyticus EKP-021]